MRAVRSVLAGLALVVLVSSTSWAQVDVAVTGGLDVTNQYMFRGIRQNTAEVSIWPFIDFGIPAWSGDGQLKSVTVNVGTWNALHTQLAGNKWYESDLYATLGLGFSKAALSFNYTSYMSPADLFGHVKEFGVKLAFDDSAALGKGALKPYVMVAFELDGNSADAGTDKGTYVELGIGPSYAGEKATVAFPIKVGLSGNNYYEFGTGTDSKFGYFSAAAIVTVPMNANWNVHGGVEVQTFGENVKNYNAFGSGARAAAGIASIGVGFSF